MKIELCNRKVDFLDFTMDLEKIYTHHLERKMPKTFLWTLTQATLIQLKEKYDRWLKRDSRPYLRLKRHLKKIKVSYESALKNSGFKTSLSYVKDIIKKKQRLRKKKVFYYNPPFSNCVKTDIGKEFLKLVSKHFPKTGI